MNLTIANVRDMMDRVGASSPLGFKPDLVGRCVVCERERALPLLPGWRLIRYRGHVLRVYRRPR